MFAKETGRIRVSAKQLDEFWVHEQAHSPTPLGSRIGALPLGVWGDDARYNRSGQKLILITVNCLLHESARSLEHNAFPDSGCFEPVCVTWDSPIFPHLGIQLAQGRF